MLLKCKILPNVTKFNNILVIIEFNYNLQDLQASCKGNYFDAYSLDENDLCYKNMEKVDRVSHIHSLQA